MMQVLLSGDLRAQSSLWTETFEDDIGPYLADRMGVLEMIVLNEVHVYNKQDFTNIALPSHVKESKCCVGEFVNEESMSSLGWLRRVGL